VNPISKGAVLELSLSAFSKLEALYPEWVKRYAPIAVLTTRLSCSQLLEKISKSNTDTSQVLVIDCVGKEKHKQAITVQSLSSLTEMAEAVSQVLKQKKIEMLIIDSLSNLIIQNDVVTTLRFANEISQKARKAGCRLVFPTLAKDSTEKLAAVEMFVDRVEEV
jgi:archaellum biogenesis ATPase FlaH